MDNRTCFNQGCGLNIWNSAKCEDNEHDTCRIKMTLREWEERQLNNKCKPATYEAPKNPVEIISRDKEGQGIEFTKDYWGLGIGQKGTIVKITDKRIQLQLENGDYFDCDKERIEECTKVVSEKTHTNTSKEMVKKPNHYTRNGAYEPLEFAYDHELSFSLGSAVKYIARAKHKGNEIEDLEKAVYCIKREIERITKDGQ